MHKVAVMKNYIQTKELTEQFHISRKNLYYWVNHNKISRPVKNATNHYMWEQKHIDEIKDVLKHKTSNQVKTVGSFELNNRRYLGNKYRLIPFIKKAVKEECPDATSFFDVFSGTGVVANAFSEMTIITNDLLFSNYICHYAFFGNGSYRIRKLRKIVMNWNKLDKVIEPNYMSVNFGGKYFSHEVASKIGYIREDINKLEENDTINKRESYILITALMYGMDKIANTCGHYDAYRKSAVFQNDMILKLPNIKKTNSKNRLYNQDANELVGKIKADIAYIDPPYNSRQYSDAYHLLENVAKWDKPKVHGIAAKMDRKHIKSDYCTVKATEAFSNLIKNLDVKYILVSYNNMGDKGNDRSNAKITDQEIRDILGEKGQVQVFEKSYKAFTTGKSDINDHKEILYLCKTYKYLEKQGEIKPNVASPINYTGGKYKLLSQIKPKFPKDITTMVDLFAGGCNVGVNVPSEKVIFIDKEPHLIGLFNCLKNHKSSEIIEMIEQIIKKYKLSSTVEHSYKHYKAESSKGVGHYNKEKFLKLRKAYNNRKEETFYTYMMFYTLLIFGFNNQIRFNQDGDYNLPVGKRDFNKNMRQKLNKFVERIQSIECEFINADFRTLDVEKLTANTFVYVDPPYLITNATYNESGGWSTELEEALLLLLDRLDEQGIHFALSNVIESKGKRNELLINWTIKNKERYKVHYLNYNYSNSNYQTKNRNKDATIEVLITNYS